MSELILKLFVKNIGNTECPTVRAACGAVAGVFGIVSNIILFVMKLIVGLISGSIAVIADAVNNLSDSASSVITLVGFKISQKPADDEHPYGHARMEYVSALFVSLIIVFIGFEFFKESISAIMNPVKNSFDIFSVVILAISMLIKLWLGVFSRHVGKKINSVALVAASYDSIGDVVATGVVLLGIIVSMAFDIAVDGYFGLAVACFIIYSGIRMLKESIDPILGTAPEEELIEKISKKVMSYDGILGFHDLVVHNYGEGRSFASLHAEVAAECDVMVSHDLIDNIEFDFKNNDNLHVVIHLDPVETNNPFSNELKKKVIKILSKMSDEISMHDFRIVRGTTHTNILFDVDVPISFDMSDSKICREIDRRVKELDCTYNTVVTVDRSYSRKK